MDAGRRQSQTYRGADDEAPPPGVTFRLFDVAQGACAHAETTGGGGMLVDCGANIARGFRPSTWLRSTGHARRLHGIILSSLDTAYVADLEPTAGELDGVRIYVVTHALPRAAKMFPGLRFEALDRFKEPVEPIEFDFFYNDGPCVATPRDSCIVTVARTSTLGVLLGGAMQRSGWQALLRQREFREALRTVDVFVAPANGSHSGFCADLFEICEPRLIVLQGGASTIVAAEAYADHASGLEFANGVFRSTLSTAAHGMITLIDPEEGPPTCATER